MPEEVKLRPPTADELVYSPDTPSSRPTPQTIPAGLRPPTSEELVYSPSNTRTSDGSVHQFKEGTSAFFDKINPVSIVKGLGDTATAIYNNPGKVAGEIFAHPYMSLFRAKQNWDAGNKLGAIQELSGVLDKPGGPNSTQMSQDIASGHQGKALGDILGQGAQIGLTMGLPKLAGMVGPKLAEHIVNRFMSTSDPLRQEGAQAAFDWNLNPTVTQASGSKLAGWVERNFAGKAKAARELEQQGKLAEGFNRGGDYLRGTQTPLNFEESGNAISKNLIKTPYGRTILDEAPRFNSELTRHYYQTPEQTRVLINNLAKTGQEGLVKGDYFDNIIADKVFNPQNNTFNPGWLIDELNNPNSVTKQIYSSAERNGMMQWARAAQTVAKDTSETGNWTMRWINGRIIMRMAGIVAGGLTKGLGVPGIEIGAEIGLKEFGKGVLLNPKYAAIAARLQKIPPSSYEAQSGMKTLLKALGASGASAVVNLPNGIKQEVDITPAGKFKIPMAGSEDNQ